MSEPLNPEDLEELLAIATAVTNQLGRTDTAAALACGFLLLHEELHRLKNQPRFTRVSDDDGHHYICPVGLVEEFEKRVSAVAEWESSDDHKAPYPDSPEEMACLIRVEGTPITFTDPREES